MDELLAEFARRLVDDPDAVRVEQVEGDDGSLVLRLHVAEGDVGKVIGRQGRIARALRTVVRAGGPSAGRRLQLEIVGGASPRSTTCTGISRHWRRCSPRFPRTPRSSWVGTLRLGRFLKRPLIVCGGLVIAFSGFAGMQTGS